MMEEQHDLAKWLAGEMNEAELQAFRKTPEFVAYDKIAHYSGQLEVPAFDGEKMYTDVINHEKKETKVIPFYRSGYFRIAAMLVIALGLFFLSRPMFSETQYAENGQQHTFSLPDDSQVVLNSGSEIQYKKWNWSDNRTLKLKGEAFFKVAKGKTFDVNTDLGKVTVVGTQFNVKARNQRFEVECFEGKVKVHFANQDIFLTKGKSVTVENGEILPEMPATTSTPVWMHNGIKFNSTPLDEIIAEMQRQYNISIEYEAVSANQKFTGILPSDNLEKGLTIISNTYRLKFKTEKNKVILSPDE